MKYKIFQPIYWLLTIITSANVTASESPTVTFSIDNDTILGVDQDYSNGIFGSYTSGKINTPTILTPLSLSIWGGTSLDKIEFTLGHKIWTPADIKIVDPIANDRPYAGYLYSEFNFISRHQQQAQRFNLTVGTTGTDSFSEQAQKLVHSITGSEEPKGWEYQVDDGIVGSIGYLTHFNLSRNTLSNNAWFDSYLLEKAEFEITSISEVNIGNFRSDVATGMMLRWGHDLGANMGAANISTEQPFRPGMIGASDSACFVFTGIEGRYRFNDITIEGERPNIITPNDYQLTLENWQFSIVFGAVWYNKHGGLSIALAAKTPDYEEAQTALYGNAAISLFAFL